MKKIVIKSLLIITISVIIIYLFRQRCNRLKHIETTTEINTDTLIVYDTVMIKCPIARDSVVLRFETVRLPIKQRVNEATIADAENPTILDSADVELPIEQHHFIGQEYEAWVSGYKPLLDSLHIHQKQQIVTERLTLTKWQKKRWGISVGAGLTITPKGVQPGIFVGATYTFVTF